MTQNPVVCYFSAGGSTHRLAQKLRNDSVRITSKNAHTIFAPETPLILLFPTYAISGSIIPGPVRKFLNNRDNRKRVVAVVGAGDKNFNEHYCYASHYVSKRLHVPLLHTFELSGTEEDVKDIDDKIDRMFTQEEK